VVSATLDLEAEALALCEAEQRQAGIGLASSPPEHNTLRYGTGVLECTCSLILAALHRVHDAAWAEGVEKVELVINRLMDLTGDQKYLRALCVAKEDIRAAFAATEKGEK
jgi:hypothetical protein